MQGTAAITEEISLPSRYSQPDMTEQEAIRQAQNGAAAAFEFLYKSHSKRVYHLCLRMIGNAAEAEDLTQEAFLQLFRKIHTFRGDSAFSTWLHRLSVNIVLMRLRKHKLKEVSIKGDEDEESERLQKEFGAPDLVLAGSVDRIGLKRALAKLPPGCRRVFLLHDVLGHEHHEIAAKLGYSIGNSKSQLHKARMRLRKLLGTCLNKNTRRKRGSDISGFVQGPLPA